MSTGHYPAADDGLCSDRHVSYQCLIFVRGWTRSYFVVYLGKLCAHAGGLMTTIYLRSHRNYSGLRRLCKSCKFRDTNTVQRESTHICIETFVAACVKWYSPMSYVVNPHQLLAGKYRGWCFGISSSLCVKM